MVENFWLDIVTKFVIGFVSRGTLHATVILII
jgi:hypothetical protein